MQSIQKERYNVLLNLNHSMIDFNLNDELRNVCLAYEDLPKKIRHKNMFFKLPKNFQKQIVENICETYPEFESYSWFIEVGKFYEPVGWHNDYNYDADAQKQCKKGFIIPLEWYENAGTQFTEFTYDKKIIPIGDKFQDVDTKEFITENILEHTKEFTTYKWMKNKIITFSSDVIHRAKPCKDKSKFKLSINALGYV